MGNVLSCKNKKKRTEKSAKKSAVSQKKKKRTKQIVLDKNRKIIQKDKELYKVVFDPEGFSVHDLALLGQKNSPETVIRKGVIPKENGRVDIISDISQLLIRRSPPLTPGKSPRAMKSPNQSIEFEIVEVNDFVDDLYLQLLEPVERKEPVAVPVAPKESSTSTSTYETNKSAK